MRAVILVPFRPDGAERDRNWRAARKRWKGWGFEIIEGASEPFERAHSRNLVAREAGEWDVALFADADIVLESREQAEAAIWRCYTTGAYTVTYSCLKYLSEQGTDYFCRGGRPAMADCTEVVGLTWECCFAVRRDTWDLVGGFDERFHGYGGQGLAFFYAYATFAGRERINGTAYHLDHPLVDRSLDEHFLANEDLCERYHVAVDNPVRMRRVLSNHRSIFTAA